MGFMFYAMISEVADQWSSHRDAMTPTSSNGEKKESGTPPRRHQFANFSMKEKKLIYALSLYIVIAILLLLLLLLLLLIADTYMLIL